MIWVSHVPSRREVERAIGSIHRAEHGRVRRILLSARTVEDNLPRQFQHAPLTDAMLEKKKQQAFEVARRFAEAEKSEGSVQAVGTGTEPVCR